MKLKLALFSTLIGYGFLLGGIFNFFDRAQLTKVGPSLIQGIFEGFGELWLQIAWFLIAFTLVHGLFGWLFAWGIQPVIARLANSKNRSYSAILLFLIATLWIILEAAGRFPHSLAGFTFGTFALSPAGWVFKQTAAILTLTALMAGLYLRIVEPRAYWRRQRRRSLVLASAAAVILAASIWLFQPGFKPFPNEPGRPHIIMIGIDGWRLDTLESHGGPEGLMPFTSELLSRAAVMEEAYTPLARTFPAWWSTLTGQFPARHGARFNLIADDLIQTEATLPKKLGNLGYHRLFAMDELRFANFRNEHGFDRVVGPCVGAADFLLGELNDTPLTNLMANHWTARYLFPCTHANRAAYITYEPVSFDRLLDRAIRNAPRQPLFLITHFELPHWPFLWASGPVGKFEPHPKGRDYAHYMETLERVDLQIEELFSTLQELQILDNAIVILLSDHGEAFSEENLQWTSAKTGRSRRTLIGHGTDPLGLTQHQVPLAFLRFGENSLLPGIRKAQASLTDILPTLAEWLEFDLTTETDGRSLMQSIQDPLFELPEHPIPIETGFNPTPSLLGVVDESTLLAEGLDYYRILPDGRLSLRQDIFDDLLLRKQRAIIMGDHILTHPYSPRTAFQLGTISTLTLEEIDSQGSPSEKHVLLLRHFCEIFALDLEKLNSNVCHRIRQISVDTPPTATE